MFPVQSDTDDVHAHARTCGQFKTNPWAFLLTHAAAPEDPFGSESTGIRSF